MSDVSDAARISRLEQEVRSLEAIVMDLQSSILELIKTVTTLANKIDGGTS